MKPQLLDFDDRDYDPFTSDELNFGSHADPYPRFAELRREGSVIEASFRGKMGLSDSIFGKQRAFLVLGHKEVTTALTDPATFSNQAYSQNMGHSFGKTISAMDPPEHVQWRRIFQKIFLPQFVTQWGEAIVDPVVNDLLAPLLPTGKADLVQQFTHLFPFHVIYRQLNLPKEDIVAFQRLAIAQTDFYNFDKAQEAGRKLGEYFRELVEIRRREPGEDLVTLLATTEADGKYLPDEVLISFLRQLMNAAGDTTYRGTSVLLTALLTHPDQLAAVRADRSLIAQAIEEALRWDGPVAMQSRQSTRDTVLGGVEIPAGSLVNVIAASANRDPEVWENPDSFDIFRPRKPHFSFARGPHMCVGQHLARVEMTRALQSLLDTMPDMELDPDMPAPQIKGALMRVPEHIHVRFTPPAS